MQAFECSVVARVVEAQELQLAPCPIELPCHSGVWQREQGIIRAKMAMGRSGVLPL